MVALLPPVAKNAFDAVLTAAQIADQEAAAARTDSARMLQEADQQRDQLLAAASAAADERIRTAMAETDPVDALEAQETSANRDTLLTHAYQDQIAVILQHAGDVTAIDPRGGQQLRTAGTDAMSGLALGSSDKRGASEARRPQTARPSLLSWGERWSLAMRLTLSMFAAGLLGIALLWRVLFPAEGGIAELVAGAGRAARRGAGPLRRLEQPAQSQPARDERPACRPRTRRLLGDRRPDDRGHPSHRDDHRPCAGGAQSARLPRGDRRPQPACTKHLDPPGGRMGHRRKSPLKSCGSVIASHSAPATGSPSMASSGRGAASIDTASLDG